MLMIQPSVMYSAGTQLLESIVSMFHDITKEYPVWHMNLSCKTRPQSTMKLGWRDANAQEMLQLIYTVMVYAWRELLTILPVIPAKG